MKARSPVTATRQPGSLRRVTKRAKGKEYQRWQWRTHRRTDTGWATVDVEIGDSLTNIRARTLVALGELKAPLLVERWARLMFPWNGVPAWTGRPAAARRNQRVAWWLELPRAADGPIKIRFRDLGAGYDFRRGRSYIAKVESYATFVWQALNDDPIVELARLLWQEQQTQKEIETKNQTLIDLRRQRRAGDLNQRDFEADERATYISLDKWEEAASGTILSYDELLKLVTDSMPRPQREAYRSQILVAVDRILNDPKHQSRWHSDQWEGNQFTWNV
jgi:hypothetical protein